MTAARDEVLRRVRDAIAVGPAVPPAPRDYATTTDLAAHAIVERFADRVDDHRATVHRASVEQLPGVVADLLADAGTIGVPAGLPPGWTGDLDVLRDPGTLSTAELDRLGVVVTGCAVAIAETGTIVLDGSPDQGRRTLTLVPDHHICIVPEDRIVGTVPEGLARLDPVRPLTLISGPSATSDIELDRVEGVHGPRRLDVVIVADTVTDPSPVQAL